MASSCANVVPPNGGPKDKDAPKLLNSATADSVLNFTGGNVVLEFDEYIKLSNVQKNFEISPLTKIRPKIKVKKKQLIVELPDSLLESNTTYTLDFGDAVQDVRESNIYKDLKITLSTGAYFDSLSLRGKVFDAATGHRDSIQVMLFPEDMHDSMLLKQRPLYVTRATRGQFSFTGLPSKKFKLAALSDKNSNYTYDSRGEKIAFINKIIDVAQPDSSLVLYSFIEDKMIDSTKVGGVTKGGKSRIMKNNGTPLSYTVVPSIKSNQKFDPTDTLRIEINDSNAVVNQSKMRFYENAALDLSVELDYDDSADVITLLPHWKMDNDYRIVLQAGFLIDTAGNESTVDTISFKTFSAEDYAAITVVLDSSLYKSGSVIQLLSKGKLVREEQATLSPLKFSKLKPTTYKLRLLYDENNNGKWDSGDLEKRKQPEVTIELPQSIGLKPNWEENVEWKKGSKKKRMGKK